jgi:hypothetical protein
VTVLQVRVRGVRSMMDIDLPALERQLGGLSQVARVTAYDDRGSDASFVTLKLELREPAAGLAQVQRAFGRRWRVTAFAVDEGGAVTPLAEVTPDHLPRLDMRNWARFGGRTE